MNPFMYINLLWWAIAAAGMIAFARFAVFVGRDVETLSTVSELMWKIVPLSALFVMVLVTIFMPWFILSLLLNAMIAGGVIGMYWMARVKELGTAGHLFSKTIRAARSVSAKRSARKAAQQVNLIYLKPDDTKMELPGPEDPVSAGLAIMDQLMIRALEQHAEMIEMNPGLGAYELKMIIDGVPYSQPVMGRDVAEPVITALKSLAALQIEDRRRPQQGVFKVRDAEGVVTVWTIRTSGSTAGEKLSLSANEKGRWDRRVEELGLAADQLSSIKDLSADGRGVVLVATPKGNGRTSTLYALLRMHDAFVNSVQTVEVVPQTEIEGVMVNRFDQRSPEATMAKLINTVLLRDPNVVLIAQIVDQPSAELVAKYSEREHRVYAGINAAGTLPALEQWVAMVGNKRLAADSLRAVIAERLVRVLCPTCRIPYQPDAATLQKLNLPLGRNLQSFKANTEPMQDAKGNPVSCQDCGGTGYRGRTGIFEVLVVTAEMTKAIAEGNLQGVAALARRNNMMLLVEHGIRKFASGVTSIQEVLRVVSPEAGQAPKAPGSAGQRG